MHQIAPESKGDTLFSSFHPDTNAICCHSPGISVLRWDYIVAKQELNGVGMECQKEQ